MCNEQYKNIITIVGTILRGTAPQYWSDKNTFFFRSSNDKLSCKGGLWFRTEGCTHAKKGCCIMCNYSSGPVTVDNDIVEYVKAGLESIPQKLKYLLVSPSGSMLDENEVSYEARINILKLLVKSKHEYFGFETRADTINDYNVFEIQDTLNGRLKEVLIGLETINGLYQKFCLNKIVPKEICYNAIQILRKNGILPAVNVVIGIPFLDDKENVTTTIETINWALNNGANHCYLFPIHVKEATPLALLYQMKKYSPPSLWSLIEVMKILKEKTLQGKIRPSWYTSLGAYNVFSSPTTCSLCFNNIVSLLDHYDQWRDRETLEKILDFSCICRDKWYSNYRKQTKDSVTDLSLKIVDGYFSLSNMLNLSISSGFKTNLHDSIKLYSTLIKKNGLMNEKY